MKRYWGVILILLVLFVGRTYAQSDCDYILSFENVKLSGTEIEDGYFLTDFSEPGYYLDICGVYTGETTDSIYAELSDELGVYLSVYGTIIWTDVTMTNAYIQTSYLDELYSTYLDGTIKPSRGRYKISAKGGDNDSISYITKFRQIQGKGDFLDGAATSLQGGRTKFRNLDKSKLFGLKKKLESQTQPAQ